MHATRRLPPHQEPPLERCLLDDCIRRRGVERSKLLCRGVWPQVSDSAFVMRCWRGIDAVVRPLRFERELEKLRVEMAASSSQHSSRPASPHEQGSPTLHASGSEGDMLVPASGLDKSPLLLGVTGRGHVDELCLNGKAAELEQIDKKDQ